MFFHNITGTFYEIVTYIKRTTMKIISTKTHGMLDYLMGIILIASPWIFGFATGGAEQWIPIILGAGALVYSMMTNYELGVFKTLSMKTHLTLDLMSGILLAASPWIFGFSDRVSTPHLILGLLEIGASLMTKATPYESNRGVNHSHAV
jgi:hypothetical protein